MLLFLPTGVLSITAHEEGPFKLVVRSVSMDPVKHYFPENTMYYEPDNIMPFKVTIIRPQLQELMFTVLESIEYKELTQSANSGRYGTLVKHVHNAMWAYPDLDNRDGAIPQELKEQVPESAEILAGMFLSSMMPKNKQMKL